MGSKADRGRVTAASTARDPDRGSGPTRSPWVALDARMDPLRWARLLRRAHELAMQRGTQPSILREVVASSWGRAASAHVDPDAVAPKVLDSAGTERAFVEHPVAHLLPLVESM